MESWRFFPENKVPITAFLYILKLGSSRAAVEIVWVSKEDKNKQNQHTVKNFCHMVT